MHAIEATTASPSNAIDAFRDRLNKRHERKARQQKGGEAALKSSKGTPKGSPKPTKLAAAMRRATQLRDSEPGAASTAEGIDGSGGPPPSAWNSQAREGSDGAGAGGGVADPRVEL